MAEFLSRRQNVGKLKDKKRKIARKEHQRLSNKFEMEGFVAQKGLWNLARNTALQDRGALPQEEGDTIRTEKVHARRKFHEQLVEGR